MISNPIELQGRKVEIEAWTCHDLVHPLQPLFASLLSYPDKAQDFISGDQSCIPIFKVTSKFLLLRLPILLMLLLRKYALVSPESELKQYPSSGYYTCYRSIETTKQSFLLKLPSVYHYRLTATFDIILCWICP